jgi:hypothetical protein
MTDAPARRSFLRTALAALTGAAAPVAMARSAWPNASVTANHSQELLVRLVDVDGTTLRNAAGENLPTPGGFTLSLFRYEGPDQLSRTVHRLVLPWTDVRAGLYVRSAVPYRTRMLLDPEGGQPTTRIILDWRASLAVYRETPRCVETLPWHVVLIVT